MMKGYWVCSGQCDDVVILPLPYGRWDAKHGVTCPVCHQDTADFISTELPQPETRFVDAPTAAKLFAQLKEAIE